MAPTTVRLDSQQTPLPADVAEWCPNPGSQCLLAVGTYKLDEGSQRRLGALRLFRLGEGGKRLAPLPGAGLDLPGVFDLRWRPRSSSPELAAALADGSLRLLGWDGEEEGLLRGVEAAVAPPSELARLGPPPALDVGCGPDAGSEVGLGPMAVSLDFSRAQGCVGEQLAASYSSGQLQLFQARGALPTATPAAPVPLAAPAGWARVAAWQAHSQEAWAAAADAWHPALLHSGGDDAAYRVWDGRQGYDRPMWQDRRSHGAGVCCVASSPHQPHAACTGSYDDRLRLWDLRAPARPLLVAELDTGGGVWRAKWHPAEPTLLLTACMYNGFAVVRADATTFASPEADGAAPMAAAGREAASGGGTADGAAGERLECLARYEHAAGSLSYGADWCWLGAARGGTSAAGSGDPAAPPAAEEAGAGGASGALLAATASFYDRQLHLWRFQL